MWSSTYQHIGKQYGVYFSSAHIAVCRLDWSLKTQWVENWTVPNFVWFVYPGEWGSIKVINIPMCIGWLYALYWFIVTLLEERIVEIHLSNGSSSRSYSTGYACIHLFLHEIEHLSEPVCLYACVCVCLCVGKGWLKSMSHHLFLLSLPFQSPLNDPYPALNKIHPSFIYVRTHVLIFTHGPRRVIKLNVTLKKETEL